MQELTKGRAEAVSGSQLLKDRGGHMRMPGRQRRVQGLPVPEPPQQLVIGCQVRSPPGSHLRTKRGLVPIIQNE